MADDPNYAVGFRKPPKNTRFVKGKSGNPMGRPKGSQNATTIIDRACRERIRVTTNGKVRHLSKFEAAMLQLLNKAASGDLRATQQLLNWLTWRMNSEQGGEATISLQECDKHVTESIVDRIRNSKPAPLATESDVPPREGGNSEGEG